MSVEGLWTIQFAKSEEDFGGLQVEEQLNRGGVFVLTGSRLYGGGLSFYFVGTYKTIPSGISLTINATRYNDIVSAPFGPNNEARMIYQGKVNGDSMILEGHVEDEPNKKLFIKAERRAGID